MGLCRGGSCWGMAFRVPATRVAVALRRLWNREMPRRVYGARLVPVRISRGRRVRALAFIADPAHPQFMRELDLRSRAQFVAQGVGERGPCTEYIRATLLHMRQLGVADPHLSRVLATAEAMRARAASRRAR
jgi:cation transport protein ChaC